MPPTRSIRSTRARTPTRPAKPSKEATRSHLQKPPAPSKRTELIMTVDGITHGWQYSHLYTEPEPEMHRQPDPSIKRPADPRAPPLKLKDLECVRSLGKGVYGRVLLVRTRRNTHPMDKPGSMYAMKVLRKKYIRMDEAQEPQAKDYERRVLMTLPWSPFVSTIIQTFYDERNLYMLTELAPCGTLRSLISARGPLPVTDTLFYLSNIICALSFLEAHGIAHRDLKPDNILLGDSGYLTLVDFGCATVEHSEKEWVMIGTPCYQAPELFSPEGQTVGFSKAIDWWAAGCILFEMVTRTVAFRGEVYKKILAGDYRYPPKVRVGKTLKSLVSALLTRDASKRLGYNGASEVGKHPWFRTVNWGKMKDRQYLAPYIPSEFNLQKWHTQPMPRQHEVPGLAVVVPPYEYTNDNRFPAPKVLE
ncbi:hypothetical protein EYR36_000790 [Pleurotus pulmonarius]|nr:hypothetical protein EYR36_004592 [Pleurotus pulmonarius]KAF4578981.1 hypothetical protein EYR36_000790 [Pleurotus pulmonarius]